MKKSIQVGVCGIRAPDGTICENVPIYKDVEENSPSAASIERQEEKIFNEGAEIFTDFIRQYRKKCQKANLPEF